MKRRAFNRSLRQNLGRRICQRREKLGLTQRGLTKLADMSSQRQVWNIEHGPTGTGGVVINSNPGFARQVSIGRDFRRLSFVSH